MSSGNRVVDSHDREERVQAKKHLCCCGSDDYVEEPHCSETGDYCFDDCEFKREGRSFLSNLLRSLFGTEPKPDPKCEFHRVLTFCAWCGKKLDLE